MSPNVPTQNPFKLISTRALELVLKCERPKESEYILNFDHKIFFFIEPKTSLEDKKIFIVEFRADVKNTSQSFSLTTKFHVVFQSEREMTAEDLESPGIRINARAIAFPFLRSFITTVTSNAGYPPVILPSINFVRLLSLPGTKSI